MQRSLRQRHHGKYVSFITNNTTSVPAPREVIGEHDVADLKPSHLPTSALDVPLARERE